MYIQQIKELMCAITISKISFVMNDNYLSLFKSLQPPHNGSVLLDCTIDTADEDVGGVEPNGPSEKPESYHHD